MSFRPAISIYVQNEIADIRFYPEWELHDLMIEAMTLGALLSLQHPETAAECRAAIDRLRKLIPLSEIRERKTLSEEKIRKELQDLEAVSDCTVKVDMTEGCAYRTDITPSDCTRSDESVLSFKNPDRISFSPSADRIPFKERAHEILLAVAGHSELRSALSGQTMEMLETSLSDLSGCYL